MSKVIDQAIKFLLPVVNGYKQEMFIYFSVRTITFPDGSTKDTQSEVPFCQSCVEQVNRTSLCQYYENKYMTYGKYLFAKEHGYYYNVEDKEPDVYILNLRTGRAERQQKKQQPLIDKIIIDEKNTLEDLKKQADLLTDEVCFSSVCEIAANEGEEKRCCTYCNTPFSGRYVISDADITKIEEHVDHVVSHALQCQHCAYDVMSMLQAKHSDSQHQRMITIAERLVYFAYNPDKD